MNNIEDNCVEYLTQPHQMWCEGTTENEPTINDIVNHANEKGYIITDIDISFDSLQKIWRYNGNIKLK